MDKYEYRVKTEKMLEYKAKKSYEKAVEIADSIDWRKIKNVPMLCAVSEIYECMGDNENARAILFLAFDRAPESKKIVYRLGALALKLNDIAEATDCYNEFLALAPNDPNQYILQYKILKAKGEPIQKQITALEEFKKSEYVEKWAYELAKLYYEAGMITECIEECDDLILWFNEGQFVYKAMELKMKEKELTPLQQEKYNHRNDLSVIKETSTEKTSVEEASAEETSAEETSAEEAVELNKMDKEIEETLNVDLQEEKKIDTGSLKIEEILKDWEKTQQENAQLIQAEEEKLQKEKEDQEIEKQDEEEESVLPEDVRELMVELEAESDEIHAQKIRQEEISQPKSLAQKVVEQLNALDIKIAEPLKKGEEDAITEGQDTALELQEIETSEVIEESEEVVEMKLGDTKVIENITKSVAEDAVVEVPEVEEAIPERKTTNLQSDTGFIVHGRYDLEAQSEVGLKAGLTEEQKKLFSYFVPVHGMSEQLVNVLHKDQTCRDRYGTSKTGNLVIIGRKGSGKTVLAVNVVKAIQKSRRLQQGKVGIVTAESLNKKDVANIVGKLSGGALVIEKASRLNKTTIDKLNDLMEAQTGEMFVVLEDTRKPIEKMLADNPRFAKKFTSRLELPVFINDELVTFAQTYAKENRYKIDEMGILALYSRIDLLQREEKAVTVAHVKVLVDEAIAHSKKVTVKNFVKKMLGKNIDDSDRIILTEDDFR